MTLKFNPITGKFELVRSLAELNTLYVQLTGAVPMTGLLTLSGSPTSDLHASTQEFVKRYSFMMGG